MLKTHKSYKTPAYHTRHIPKELLNLNTPSGKNVLLNGLCDTLDSEVLKKLKDCGVELVETRVVWWEIEDKSGHLDFSCLEKRLDKIEKAGLKAGVFPWFQHPPAWYDPEHINHVRFRCLEHNTDSTIISLWDPKTSEVYDRLYGELASSLGDRISFLYAGIAGDFGEVCYPSGVKHYVFSPHHNHHGFWCGDILAKKLFAEEMERKYLSLDKLNKAWGTHYNTWTEDLMPVLLIEDNSLMRRYDFGLWYIESLMNFTDLACGIVRQHFKNTDIGIPLGFSDESLPIGQIKSLSVKAAAKHNMVARWTGMAHLGSFEKSNMLARRFASAAHFYNTNFATEAALILTADNAANGLYESLANGASIIHDDPQNIFRAFDVHNKLRPKMIVSPPITSVMVFYPVETELIEGQILERGFPEKLTDFAESFISRGSDLRRIADYDICDSTMIRDDYLSAKVDLFFLINCVIPEDIISLLIDFAKNGGRIWLYKNSEVCLLEPYLRGSKKFFCDIAKAHGVKSFRTNEPGSGGIYSINSFPKFEIFRSLMKKNGSEDFDYITVHEGVVSRYNALSCDIDICPILNNIKCKNN